MSLPTEAEIQDAAQRLGHVGADGTYPRHLRPKLAKAVQLAGRDTADAADPTTGRTADLLARFDSDLQAAGFADETFRRELLVETARHLFQSAGLRLNDPTT